MKQNSYTCGPVPVTDLFQHCITSTLHAASIKFIICHKTQNDNFFIYLKKKKDNQIFRDYMHNFICGFNVLVTDFVLNFLITFL